MSSGPEHILELKGGSFQFSSTLFQFSKGGECFHESAEQTRTIVTGAAALEIPVRNILWVEEGEEGVVQVSALVKKGKKHALRQLDGVAMKSAAVAEWTSKLLDTAYNGTHRGFLLV